MNEGIPSGEEATEAGEGQSAPEQAITYAPPPTVGVLAGSFDSGKWRETSQRVRLTAPGFPRWIVTADRTYYPVTLVEGKDGLTGQVDVHPGHVSELKARDGGVSHREVR